MNAGGVVGAVTMVSGLMMQAAMPSIQNMRDERDRQNLINLIKRLDTALSEQQAVSRQLAAEVTRLTAENRALEGDLDDAIAEAAELRQKLTRLGVRA